MNGTALEFLKSRKSVPLSQIIGPGPTDEQLMELLGIASRVPDHGRMEPWRFIIYRGEDAQNAGNELAALAEKRRGPLTDDEMARERARLSRAPLAVGVVSSITDSERIPEWEQFLSAGAVAMNLVTAATSAGFAANWITGWFCDDPEGRAIIGLEPHERMAGIVHLGHCDVKVPDRPRPDVGTLVSVFEYKAPKEV